VKIIGDPDNMDNEGIPLCLNNEKGIVDEKCMDENYYYVRMDGVINGLYIIPKHMLCEVVE
jgi:hypothetical protein